MWKALGCVTNAQSSIYSKAQQYKPYLPQNDKKKSSQSTIFRRSHQRMNSDKNINDLARKESNHEKTFIFYDNLDNTQIRFSINQQMDNNLDSKFTGKKTTRSISNSSENQLFFNQPKQHDKPNHSSVTSTNNQNQKRINSSKVLCNNVSLNQNKSKVTNQNNELDLKEEIMKQLIGTAAKKYLETMHKLERQKELVIERWRNTTSQ